MAGHRLLAAASSQPFALADHNRRASLRRTREHDDDDRRDELFVQFVRQAAHAMTQVLVDHARRRGVAKRGGGRRRVDLDDAEAAFDEPGFDWLSLDEALDEMHRNDPRRHSVVVLRFFAGLDNRQIARQIARQLAIGERTVGRDWTASKLWLRQRLDGAADS